jgi:glycosyltransferase involved in cell wall biosynthesis
MTTAAAPAFRLWVVVPCFNEAAGIGATLAALAKQTDGDFVLLIVDNASTDGTRSVVEAQRAAYPGLAMLCIAEAQKGTGAAADTGFCFAIRSGATHIARTDADCLPNPQWVASIKRAFSEGAEFVAGAIGLRDDDHRLGRVERAGLLAVTALMALVAPLLPHNRGPQFKTRYVMASGGNLALSADLYVASGGFPRIRLEDGNEDRELVNRVRCTGAAVRRDRRVVVLQSARRIKRFGVYNTLLWYWERRYRPDEVDIR